MTTAWTTEQITALAPDAASLTAARKLRGKWSGTGQHDTALWGLCKGSGSTPYQTVVDLSGPAYKCSCPSRKFPCKHSLGLLLTWAEGGVAATGTVASFAAEWLAGRAAREAKKAAPEAKSPRTANPVTADQRHARVCAGLADLDTWLTDQVRTGLAQTDRSHTAFEAVAARMVDAQAPGVAAALRHLPRLAAHADWPRLLLTEFARLHLLATAHRRLDDLSPALRAGVRAHIGYPHPADAVRTEPPVRDHWMVVGQRVTSEDNLYTRRVWLRGRTTARWALILDHHYGGPSFPPDTPFPGSLVDAELHFYPGAAPLRAIWGERHAIPEPFTTIPLAPGNSADNHPGSISSALHTYAAAIGADPFLRSWPICLAEVIPLRDETGWHVLQSDNSTLPISTSDGEPWRLLGLSGGHPLTLIGEWTAAGLIPISALADGSIVDTAPADIGSAAAPAATGNGTADLVSVALVGTARRPIDAVSLTEPVATLAARLAPAASPSDDPAARLLETVALQDCFARGGVVTTASTARPVVAEDDPRPLLPQAAGARLAALLADNSPFLEEWFAAAEQVGYRAPDSLASVLLERAKALATHREPLLRLAGARGRWLAGQHPGWKPLVRAAAEDESVWSHGRAAERRAWLTELRRRDPDAARAALAGSWGTESGPGKAELLAVLGAGLSLADETLLETALDDRRAEVRRTAADLLGRLPDSAFARRMAERAAAWLSFGRRLSRPQLTTTGPGVLDDAARRDGVGDAVGYLPYQAEGSPDVAAEWLHRVVAATPLRQWERLLGPAEQAVRVSMSEGVRGPMFAGWSDAVLAQRDPEWARALFAAYAEQPAGEADSEKLRELFALQPLDDQIRHLRKMDSSWLAEIESLLRAVPHPWPAAMAEHVLRLLLERADLCADRPGAPSLVPGSYRTLFRASSTHFPVTVSGTVTTIARKCADPYWEQAFDQLAHDLIQRKTMLEELQ
ncbi:SWIM zinc finger family protein [Nocardia sp. 2]|uniref:SWIM zinc finger family protein n=1 Tax=Nocardia acididurans TaxID=2802282 RepID=A0ABS1M6E0_9NOCA|nr:SWIM zinc finger family protein [Nocardia acididurans]MBL1076212.1 SWIM zinc finger family protein [Nocardia acididurans]